jgi:hypothetical protein
MSMIPIPTMAEAKEADGAPTRPPPRVAPSHQLVVTRLLATPLTGWRAGPSPVGAASSIMAALVGAAAGWTGCV